MTIWASVLYLMQAVQQSPELPTQIGIGGIFVLLLIRELIPLLRPLGKNGHSNGVDSDRRMLIDTLAHNNAALIRFCESQNQVAAAMAEMNNIQSVYSHNLQQLIGMYERDREWQMHQRDKSRPQS